MKQKIVSILKQVLVFLVLVFLMTLVLDWFRSPSYPDNFVKQKFTTITGKQYTLNELSQEKPLLVYVWASWCSICRLTTPSVSELYNDGYNVISIAMRSGDDNKILAYLDKKDISIPVINDSKGHLMRAWKVAVTPTFIIIDKGQVIYSTTGWTSKLGLKLRLMAVGLVNKV